MPKCLQPSAKTGVIRKHLEANRLAREVCVLLAMRIAIPHWQGRVSPVFDVAGSLLLVDVTDKREVGRRDVPLTVADPALRARQVADLPTDVLICGAISWPLELALQSAGVEVVSQICGQVEEVMQSFLAETLEDGAFLMPGCCGRRRFRGGRGGGCWQSNGCDEASRGRPRRMGRNRKGV